MEADDEIKNGDKNSYDFGARMYDPRVGRWLSTDGYEVMYPFISPYSYAVNTPIQAIDPDGNDVILLVWATSNGEVGHAAIAISNYKEVNYSVVEDGKKVTKTVKVPDGTYTYYDLWPGGAGAGKDNATMDVDAIYQKKMNITLEDITYGDPSGGEYRPADGVIKIKSNSVKDQEVKSKLDAKIKANKDYNGASNNCSDFAECAIEEVLGKDINADETVKTGLASTTPNSLFKAVRNSGGVTEVLKDPGSKVENGFIGGAFGYGPLGKLIELIQKVEVGTEKPSSLNNGPGGSMSSICFVSGTMISTPNGLVSIEKISVGDTVYSVDINKMTIEKSEVKRVDSPIHSEFIKIKFSNSKYNENTYDHPYYVLNKGWCSFSPDLTEKRYDLNVRRLEVGDICFSMEDGKIIQVEIIEIIKNTNSQITYNLSDVSNNHNFFANGVLVHNKIGR